MSRVHASLREFVRQRASGYCEYCGKPEVVARFPFHVDHIVALKHGGSSTSDNLAWACFQCNSAKGSNIASLDDATGEVVALYNPRQQRWLDHFRLDGSLIIGISPVGRVTVSTLRLNDPEKLELRERHLRLGNWGYFTAG